MTDSVIVALIAAVPSTCTFVLTAAVVWKAWHVPTQLGELVIHTNSLTDKLMDQTALAAHAKGMQAEKDVASAAIDTQAAVILAAAQLAAEKILAAAKLAEHKPT
jgi:hypothetical protein